jgi:hypothetical protein
VPYPVLNKVLDQEGTRFHRVGDRWQPQDLIPDPYRRNLLLDAQERYELLKKAEDELQSLERAYLYVKILKRMYLTIRRAQFAWRVSDLDFIEAIAEFFTDYGTVLRNLKFDRRRGRLGDQE